MVLLVSSAELEVAQTKRQSHLGHLEVVCKLVLCQIPSSHEEKGLMSLGCAVIISNLNKSMDRCQKHFIVSLFKGLLNQHNQEST